MNAKFLPATLPLIFTIIIFIELYKSFFEQVFIFSFVLIYFSNELSGIDE